MSICIAVGRSRAHVLRPPPRLVKRPAAAAAAFLLAGLTAAWAADLPVKAPSAPVYSWSGCYVGLNAGGGASGINFTSTVDPGSHLVGADPGVVGMDGTGSANAINVMGGGQAGCNWQVRTLVFGLEGDLDYFRSNPQFVNASNTLSDGVTPFGVTQSVTTNFFATVRPRIGVAADRNLAYITGGAAFSDASYTQSYTDGATPAGSGTATGSKALVGWTVGAGWEHAWADHWTFKLEYLFASFPTTNALGSISDPAGGTNALHGSADLVVQTVRAGINFRF